LYIKLHDIEVALRTGTHHSLFRNIQNFLLLAYKYGSYYFQRLRHPRSIPHTTKRSGSNCHRLCDCQKISPEDGSGLQDMRLSGEEFATGLISAFTSCGIDVADAGLTGTENAYFISGSMPYDMVIMISASHNPPQYNGLKIVLKGPIAVSGDSGLNDI